MLRTGWLIGTAILWLSIQIICSVAAWSQDIQSLTPITRFIESTNMQDTTSILGVVTGVVTFSIAAIQLLIDLFTFNYAFFTGIYVIVQYFFMCISFGLVVSLILTIYSSR